MNKLEKIKKMLYKTNVGSNAMEDLTNFECEITDKRIIEELEYTLEKTKWDGWEHHLENPQQIKSLECLIKKVKNIV